jgi:hypothetical protein
MSNQFEAQHVERAGLRTICTAIDEVLARMTATAPASVADELRGEWAKLVALLALGPPRRLRACPVCNHVGMFEATRCGHCWSKLPLATARDALPE